MGDARRQFDEEFKRDAVELCRNSDKTLAQVARDLGISRSVLARWQREQTSYGNRAFPGTGKLMAGTAHEEEIRCLKKELALAKEERDILKNIHGRLRTNNR
jgi:transposase